MSLYASAQFINQPTQPYKLFIGGQIFAHSLDSLHRLQIKAVCSIGSDHFVFPKHIKHLYLQIEDTEDEDISKVFEKAFDFIESCRKQGNVLVHCIAGVSRSTTIIAYYLMKKYKITTQVALQQIRDCRSFIRPNNGFFRQLKLAQKTLGIKSIHSRL